MHANKKRSRGSDLAGCCPLVKLGESCLLGVASASGRGRSYPALFCLRVSPRVALARTIVPRMVIPRALSVTKVGREMIIEGGEIIISVD